MNITVWMIFNHHVKNKVVTSKEIYEIKILLKCLNFLLKDGQNIALTFNCSVSLC